MPLYQPGTHTLALLCSPNGFSIIQRQQYRRTTEPQNGHDICSPINAITRSAAALCGDPDRGPVAQARLIWINSTMPDTIFSSFNRRKLVGHARTGRWSSGFDLISSSVGLVRSGPPLYVYTGALLLPGMPSNDHASSSLHQQLVCLMPELNRASARRAYRGSAPDLRFKIR